MKNKSHILNYSLLFLISIASFINLYAINDEIKDPPNVLLIICDDLNTDIEGWGGHPQTLTPI